MRRSNRSRLVVSGARFVVVEQAYLDSAKHPRDERALHTNLSLVVDEEEGLHIAAGQNTVRA